MTASLAEVIRQVRTRVERGDSLPERASGSPPAELVAPAAGVAGELCDCAQSPLAGDVFGALLRSGLLPVLIPETAGLAGVAQSPPHRYDVLEHTLAVVRHASGLVAALTGRGEAASPTADARVVWALGRLETHRQGLADRLGHEVAPGRSRGALLVLGALLHDIAKPSTRSVGEDGRIHFYRHEDAAAPIVRGRLPALGFGAAEVDFIAELVLQHLRPLEFPRESALPARLVRRFFRDTPVSAPEVCLLSLADQLGKGDQGEERKWRLLVERVGDVLDAHAAGPPAPAAAALLSGTELMAALGLRPGRLVGQLLGAVRDAQQRGEVSDRDGALEAARRALAGLGTTGDRQKERQS